MRAVFYHGVVDKRVRRGYLDYLFADVHDFEEQVATIARNWRPLALAEVHDHLVAGTPLPENAVHVSFDDGFRNTLTAAEILDRHRVPWTLFVVSEAVLSGYEPWYVRLARAVTASTFVRGGDGTVHDLSDQMGKWTFAHLVKVELMTAPASATDDLVDAVLARPGMRHLDDNPWPFLTSDELRELSRAGVEIGNHSARHRNLVRCRTDELDLEVDESRAALAEALAERVRFFAYPDGRHSRRVRERVGRSHDLALATWTARPGFTPLAIGRIDAPRTASELSHALTKWRSVRAALQSARWELPPKGREKLRRLAPRLGPRLTAP